MIILIGVLFFMLGLYVGKKRAKGMGWVKISKDLYLDIYKMSVSVWTTVSAPFRKENVADIDIPNENN